LRFVENKPQSSVKLSARSEGAYELMVTQARCPPSKNMPESKIAAKRFEKFYG